VIGAMSIKDHALVIPRTLVGRHRRRLLERQLGYARSITLVCSRTATAPPEHGEALVVLLALLISSLGTPRSSPKSQNGSAKLKLP
jgi:hypothetical protein